MNKKVIFRDLGLIDYQEAWNYQSTLLEQIATVKTANRQLPANEQQPTDNYLLFCRHPHVYTLGKSGDAGNLLLDEHGLEQAHASFYKVNRGGDITYHGPGQLTGYPILDLDNFFTDIHKYLRYLEEAIILTLAHYGLQGTRVEGFTGVWINDRKICAIGVRTSRWVTMHGFGFNINPDLNYFGNIVPCGIADKAVTSLEKELGHAVNFEEVEAVVIKSLETVFGMEVLR